MPACPLRFSLTLIRLASRCSRKAAKCLPGSQMRCTHEGLRAAQASVREGIRVNMTLCFSQEQAAAVYGATKGAAEPVYVSPFVGRLDDRGDNGMDFVKNIVKMFAPGDGHVHVLAA